MRIAFKNILKSGSHLPKKIPNIFKFLCWLFYRVKKRLDYKDKVNFKIYDVTAWLTNNYNTHIAQYLTRWRQLGNEFWTGNRILQEKYFSSKAMQKMRQRD